MALITLIRHGESVWNGERRIQGNQDPPLSPRGRRQAALLAARLGVHLAQRPAALYASPLRRAAETAEIVAAAFSVPVLPEPGLREIGLGAWEGRTVPEIRAGSPGAYEAWLQDPQAHPAPGGERLEAFAARVTAAFERLRGAHPGADLVLVSHGGPIKVLLCHTLGLDVRLLFRIKQDNTALSAIQLDGETRRVVLLNDTCHLRDAGADVAPRDVLTDAGPAADVAP